MKRPIAMRCTQEQFDSIKDRIKFDTYNVDSFETYPYLTNNLYDCVGKIGNTLEKDIYDREIHETFNADIFLEACVVEVAKTWKASEMQFKDSDCNEWIDCIGDRKYRLKPQPNYDKEIEALQQKAKENGMKVIIKFEKL